MHSTGTHGEHGLEHEGKRMERTGEGEGEREEKEREQRGKKKKKKEVETVMRFMTLMWLNRHLKNENSN